MLEVEYQVIHAVPGRVRLRVPRLRQDEYYGLKVQGLLEAIEPVIEAQVFPVNQALIIQYQRAAFSQAQLQQQLATILEQALAYQPTQPLAIKLPGYQSNGLTLYELAQAHKIKRWWLEIPNFLTTLIARLLGVFGQFTDWLIPEKWISETLTLCDRLAEKWQEEWEQLKHLAGVEKDHDWQQVSLADCDHLAKKVQQKTLATGEVEGTIAGLMGVIGVIGEIPLSIVQSLQTIQRIGLCYGYSTTTEQERNFAWIILAAATAQTPEAKWQAVDNLRDSHRQFSRQAFDNLLTEIGDKGAISLAAETIFQQATIYLAPSSVGGAIPWLGAISSGVGLSFFLNQVADAARRAYQMRWLLDNQKLSCEL